MEVEFAIEYHELVVREDMPRLALEWRRRIQQAIEEKLSTSPEKFGKPLRRSLHGYRKLRVGDYRIIFKILEKKVRIFIIQHRNVVYKSTAKRL